MKTKKCILFVRVSTLQQSYTEQAKQLAIYAQSKGFSTENQIVIANKESATKLSFEEREGLKELYDRINTDDSIKAVFVAEVSRIARREDVIFKFKTTLIERKINLFIQHDNLQLFNDDDSINTAAELMFSLLSTLAKQEMIDKQERFKKGKLRALSEGKVQTGKALFGYYKTEDKTVAIEPEQAAAISINVIDSILWDEARAEYTFGKNNKEEQAKRIIKRYESEIEEAEQAIKEAEQEQERLNYLFTKGRKKTEDYDYEYERAESQINNLKSQINDLYMKISSIEVEDTATLKTFNKLDSELDDAAKQAIIQEYIEKVFVKKEAESAEEAEHFTIEVLTMTHERNVYKYYPKQREIILPESEDPEVFRKEALGNKQSVLCELYKRVKTTDFVKIRFHRVR